MQVQAFEGYLENGRFYSLGLPMQKLGKRRAILTVLEEPAVDEKSAVRDEPYSAWHMRLKEAVALSMDEELPDLSRSKDIRPPINLAE